MTTDIEELLRAGDPTPDLPSVGLLALDVAREVSATHRRPFLASRKRRMLAFSAAGLVLVPGAAIAATVHFTAETGHYGKAGMTENDTSQYIDMCANDIDTYVQTLAPTTRPLPAGVNWSGSANTSPRLSTPTALPAVQASRNRSLD